MAVVNLPSAQRAGPISRIARGVRSTGFHLGRGLFGGAGGIGGKGPVRGTLARPVGTATNPNRVTQPIAAQGADYTHPFHSTIADPFQAGFNDGGARRFQKNPA